MKDGGDTRFLFENTGTTYYDKGFEMLQVLKDHYRPSSISRNVPIEMADTLYGRFLATQKRDAERAYQHMDAEEREAFLRKLTEIDTDDAKDGQSPPSSTSSVPT